ncbi:hypothetical protein [Streptomyces sp. NPDC047070]|uniref:hypothetical protein n=1 Tax=Streptomyces sp. NPDC047070 TaxID=3154923 RepID=UPI003456EF15
MSPDARERWIQRILDGQGVRPVGHQEARDETIPQGGDTAVMASGAIGNPFPLWTRRKPAAPATQAPAVPPRPTQPPAPSVPPPTAPQTAPATAPAQQAAVPLGWLRLPKWGGGGGQLPTGPQVPTQPQPAPAAPAPAPAAPAPAAPAPAAPAPAPAAPAPAGPVAGGPVEKVAHDDKGRPTQRKTAIRKRMDQAVSDDRLRIVAFNGTAAGVGKLVGFYDVIAAYLPFAEKAALGTFGLVLAAGVGYGTWVVTGHSAVRAVFQERTPLLRVVVTPAFAEIGRRLAPAPVQWLNEYGQEWGLGPNAISLLVTAGGIGGVLYWFIDRRTRRWHWLPRWIFRIPLATVVVAACWHTAAPLA